MKEEPSLRAATNLGSFETCAEEARDHLRQNPEGHFVVIVLCSKLDDETVLESVISQYHHITPLKPVRNLRLVSVPDMMKGPHPSSPFAEGNPNSMRLEEEPDSATDPTVA